MARREHVVYKVMSKGEDHWVSIRAAVVAAGAVRAASSEKRLPWLLKAQGRILQILLRS
jgi:hypothetical protein